MKRRHPRSASIPEKANKILNINLVVLLLFLVRIWHLSVVQYDSRKEFAEKPQRKQISEPAKRATIRDRYNLPMAMNAIQYNAAVVYAPIRQVPQVGWTHDAQGKKVKVYKRREYIKNLAGKLSEILHLDPDHVEDLIHAKAALFFYDPYVLKEDISEEEYYKLKMLERQWPGICAQRSPKRIYPFGKVGCDVIGYMGAINREEYEAVVREIKQLRHCLAQSESGELTELPAGYGSLKEVWARLKELRERSYGMRDYVGKSGIEGRFEEVLRGYQGRRSYWSDSRGTLIHELPGASEPVAGQRVVLTLSAELQEYAERLLAENEVIREVRISKNILKKGKDGKVNDPWIKGGAIVAMDPYSGEVLALASYPRFDPNDFIASGNKTKRRAQQSRIQRWFEAETYVGEIWDQVRPLERERYDEKKGFYDDSLTLKWKQYLDLILPETSAVRGVIDRMRHLREAILIQESFEKLLALSGQDNSYWLLNHLFTADPHRSYRANQPEAGKLAMAENLRENRTEVALILNQIGPYLSRIPNNYEKVLLIDLCRVLVQGDLFSQNLIDIAGGISLSDYRDASAAMGGLKREVRNMVAEQFHHVVFVPWKEEFGKAYIKEKRAEEKAEKRYALPYLDYFERKEKEMFAAFWEAHEWTLMRALLSPGGSFDAEVMPFVDYLRTWQRELDQGAHQALPWRNSYLLLAKQVRALPDSMGLEYLQTLRTFQELDRPLLGSYRYLRKNPGGEQLTRHLAAAFYPRYGYGTGRSHAYRQATTQGSLFKIVTAYQALIEKYQKASRRPRTFEELNPMMLTDVVREQEKVKGKGYVVGYTDDGKQITQLYKGGRVPRSYARNIGRVGVIEAFEHSSNPYFCLLAGEVIEDPENLCEAAREFSYGKRTGIDLPGEIAGRLPGDLSYNRNGLYAFAIGQHTLIVTPLQAAVMLSAISNGGDVLKPQIVKERVGAERREEAWGVEREEEFPYQENLRLIGIDYPLFTALENRFEEHAIHKVGREVTRRIAMPKLVKEMLFEMMGRVVHRAQTVSIWSLSRSFEKHPEAISDLMELKGQLVGKTSTSESVENVNLDPEKGTNTYNHIWFGGIALGKEGTGEKGGTGGTGDTIVIRDREGKPELVVVVYLRYGGWGKDATPLGAQIATKWREIRKRREGI